MTDRPGLLERLQRLLGLVPALELDLSGAQVRVTRPGDLATLLRGRTEATADLCKMLSKLPADALRAQLAQTTTLRRRLEALQEWCFETGDPVRAGWHELTDARFVEEQGWPSLLRQLAGDVHDAYRRVALHRFMQYLDSRRAAIEFELNTGSRQRVGSWSAELPGGVDRREDPFADPSFTSMRKDSSYGRLPNGEEVVVEREFGRPIPVYLAHRRVRLIARDGGWALCDARDAEIPLRPGRTVIGRGTDCDVVLDGAPPDVSRHHLVIICEAASLRLVDMSSQGTYLPVRAVDGHLLH